MTAVAVAPLAAGDPVRYGTLAAGLAIMVGVVCLFARLLRAGVLAELLSKPVLIGYLAGVAVNMIGSQLGKVTGVDVEGDTVPAQLTSFIAGLGGASVPTVLLYGVLAAVAVSVVELLRRLARPHDAVLGFVPGVVGMHDLNDYPDARPLPCLVVYRYDAPLCFANAEDFRASALAAADGAASVRWFVLNAETNVELGVTAEALESLITELRRRDIVFATARVKQNLRDVLVRAGLVEMIGVERMYMTLPTADGVAAPVRC
jgi:MFS superfamily sulfate permease-like transporter